MLVQSGIVENLIARLDGPLHFRFIMQPTMASILAIIDGVKDAKARKPAYFWAVLVSPGHRKELIKDGWKSIFKLFILAMVLEVVYQLITHHIEYRGLSRVFPFGSVRSGDLPVSPAARPD